MHKCHLISVLIGARHFIAFVSLLTLIVGSQHVSAQIAASPRHLRHL